MFICPVCKNILKKEVVSYICEVCETRYPIKGNVPILLKDEIQKALIERDRELLNAFEIYNRPPRLAYLQCNKLISKKNKKILDLGAGYGGLSKLLFEQNKEVYAMDISPNIAIEVSKFAPFPYIVGEAENIPFEDNFFDTVVSIQSFPHFINPERVVKEMRRVLVEKGEVIITIENIIWFYYRILMVLGKWGQIAEKNGRHFISSMYSYSDLLKLFKKQGFEPIADASTVIYINKNKKKIITIPLFKNLLSINYAIKFKLKK